VNLVLTVTLNAAIDRTLTVPNFQRGQRHRASQGLTLAGGKGITIARALKALQVPVVATGLAGGRTGRRIVEELTQEAILNDFVPIDDESRTSTIVVDPAGSTVTEINEWGPSVRPDELDQLLGKIHYLSRGADLVVLAGSLPRDVDEAFYGELLRDLTRRGISTVIDSEGEPLRLAIEAEPFFISTNQREAERLVGQEFATNEDFAQALEDIAEFGARNVLITYEGGVFARLREGREIHRFGATAPDHDEVSSLGASDVLLAGYLASHLEGRSPYDSVRHAVAAGAASTLEVGTGRFDPREGQRLAHEVHLESLQPVALEG
jgi:1-phosphofructokinase/tagatose 6-phosphate kinase